MLFWPRNTVRQFWHPSLMGLAPLPHSLMGPIHFSLKLICRCPVLSFPVPKVMVSWLRVSQCSLSSGLFATASIYLCKRNWCYVEDADLSIERASLRGFHLWDMFSLCLAAACRASLTKSRAEADPSINVQYSPESHTAVKTIHFGAV